MFKTYTNLDYHKIVNDNLRELCSGDIDCKKAKSNIEKLDAEEPVKEILFEYIRLNYLGRAYKREKAEDKIYAIIRHLTKFDKDKDKFNLFVDIASVLKISDTPIKNYNAYVVWCDLCNPNDFNKESNRERFTWAIELGQLGELRDVLVNHSSTATCTCNRCHKVKSIIDMQFGKYICKECKAKKSSDKDSEEQANQKSQEALKVESQETKEALAQEAVDKLKTVSTQSNKAETISKRILLNTSTFIAKTSNELKELSELDEDLYIETLKEVAVIYENIRKEMRK